MEIISTPIVLINVNGRCYWQIIDCSLKENIVLHNGKQFFYYLIFNIN